MNIDKVKDIAKRVRRKCELFSRSPEASKHDFYKTPDLVCMCAVASFALSKALNKSGIRNKVIKGYYGSEGHHCWVELKNGMIIDITATQFGIRQRVLIVSNDSLLFHKYKDGKPVCYQDLNSWDNQAPKKRLTKKIIDIDIPVKI